MTIEKLIPTCNLNTVKDGRGAIFTFIPKDPIPSGEIPNHQFSVEVAEGLMNLK